VGLINKLAHCIVTVLSTENTDFFLNLFLFLFLFYFLFFWRNKLMMHEITKLLVVFVSLIRLLASYIVPCTLLKPYCFESDLFTRVKYATIYMKDNDSMRSSVISRCSMWFVCFYIFFFLLSAIVQRMIHFNPTVISNLFIFPFTKNKRKSNCALFWERDSWKH
jgi:hypothetical protein